MRVVAFAVLVYTCLPSTASAQFIDDRLLISVASDGGPANGSSGAGAINQAGTIVAFPSRASNLVPGDTNGAADVFVRDLLTGTTTRVSVTSGGSEGATDSGRFDHVRLGEVDLDDSGRFIVFTSTAALVASDTNSCPAAGYAGTCPDVYLRDRLTNQTARVSVGAGGLQANGASFHPRISADGAWITFHSDATNLVPGDTNGRTDVFLVERASGMIKLASGGLGGPADSASFYPSISDDGRYIAFVSGANNLTSAPRPLPCTPGAAGSWCGPLPYVFDRISNSTARVPMPPGFAPSSDGSAIAIDIAPDARLVAVGYSDGSNPPGSWAYDRISGRVLRRGRGTTFDGITAMGGTYITSPNPIGDHGAESGAFLYDVFNGDDDAFGTSVRARLDLAAGGKRVLALVWGGNVSNLREDVYVINRDYDEDGMTTSWERRFGLNPASSADAGFDPDGDGLTNRVEFQSGGHPRGTHRAFLAEGAQSGFFSTDLAVYHPYSAYANSLVIREIGENGLQLSTHLTLSTQRLLSHDGITLTAPDSAFSTLIESTAPLPVERTMTWDGASGYGSHAERAVPEARTSWYLAEGATHGGFLLYYLLQNPGASASTVTIDYLRPAPLPPIVRVYTVPGRSRRTVWVNGVDPALAATDVSARIQSTEPIVVERSMYRDVGSQVFGLGLAAAGASTAPRWFLAEGASGPFFDLFYLLANPSAQNTRVQVTYLLTAGAPIVKEYEVAAQSRRTISVAQEDARLANATMSAIVESLDGAGIVVERSMYWPAGGAWHEGHVSAGSTVTSRRWAVAGGRNDSGTGEETYVLIANTSPFPGTAVVTLQSLADFTVNRTIALAANSRVTVRTRDLVSDGSFRNFGVYVESDGPELVVERATYRNAGGVTWAAGSAALATPLP